MEPENKDPEKNFISRVLETALSVNGFGIFAAVFGIAVLINFITKFGLSLVTLAVAIIGALVIAFLYLVFSWAVGTHEKHRSLPAIVLIWTVTGLLALSLCMLFWSCFFDAPLPIRTYLVKKISPATTSDPTSTDSSKRPEELEKAPAITPPENPTRAIDDVAINEGTKETFVLKEMLGGEVKAGAWPPNYSGGTVKMSSNLKVEVRPSKPQGFCVHLVGAATFEELGGDGTKLHTSIDQQLKTYPSATELSITTQNPSGSLSWSEAPGNPKDDPPKQFSSGQGHPAAPSSGLVSMWRVYVHNGKLEVTLKEIRITGTETVGRD